MMNRFSAIILSFLWLIPLQVLGQTDTDEGIRIALGSPVYSQYLHNGLMVNPAYAGSREALSIGTSYRLQWMGMDGAPTLQSLSLHSPLKKDNVALGLKAQFMQYGVTKESSIHAIYAYHLKFSKSRLSFGVSGGVDMGNTNYGSLQGIDPDNVFSDNTKPTVLPNVGVGIYYYSKSIFAGVSVPTFLSYRNMGDGKTELYHSFNEYTFLATAGGLISFSSNLKFKPSMLVEYNLNQRLNKLDINGNLILFDIIWIGGSWRTTEQVVVGHLQANITPQLMMGLSYDYPIGRMNTYSRGSVEVVLRYEFGSKVSAANPRYF